MWLADILLDVGDHQVGRERADLVEVGVLLAADRVLLRTTARGSTQ